MPKDTCLGFVSTDGMVTLDNMSYMNNHNEKVAE